MRPDFCKTSNQTAERNAKKCKTRTEFAERFSADYAFAREAGILEDVCSHMERQARGFDINRPGIFYYYRVIADDGTVLYKAGITGQHSLPRYAVRDRKRMTLILWETYEDGKDALDRETQVLRDHRSAKYNGPKVLRNGNTELFTSDVLGVDHNFLRDEMRRFPPSA
jgi:hypothetical protein